jgi:hypothetical protein
MKTPLNKKAIKRSINSEDREIFIPADSRKA